MKITQIAVIAALLALGNLGMRAGEPTLKIGSPAPKLQVSKWVQGDAVKEFKKDTAYIVEFWATWCGPCRVSIPHLNEIHTKFKDKGLVVIGQDCWEQDESKVTPFIKQMGDKMTYRVALDSKEGDSKGKMAETWMEAAGQNGIPTAFIVDKEGKIAWIGHPMTLKDDVIEQVLAGKYDVKKAAADYDAAKQQESKLADLSRQLSRDMQNKDWDKAEATLADIAKALPEAQQGGLNSVRLAIALGRGDMDAAATAADKLGEFAKDNSMMLNQVAWQLATYDGVKGAALKSAAKIAARANQLTEGKDAAILDTLARLTFMQDKKDQAIELQEKAIKFATDDGLKEQLQKTLESYKKGELPSAE